MLIKSGLPSLCSLLPAATKVKTKPERQPPPGLGLWILQVLFTQGLRAARLWAPRKGHGPWVGGGPGLRAGMWAKSTEQAALLGIPLPGHREHRRAAAARWIYPGLIRGACRSEVALWTPFLLTALPEPSVLWLCSLSLPSPPTHTGLLSISLPPGPSSCLILTNLCAFVHCGSGFRHGLGSFLVWMMKAIFAHEPLGRLQEKMPRRQPGTQ